MEAKTQSFFPKEIKRFRKHNYFNLLAKRAAANLDILALKAKTIDFIRVGIWRIRVKDISRTRYFFVKQLRILLLAIRGFAKDKCPLSASALTFYSILSIVPIVAMAFGIAKGFGFQIFLEKQLLEKFSGQEEVHGCSDSKCEYRIHPALKCVYKKERIKKRIYKTRNLARADIFDYIEVFYNQTRRHSHLGGVSPEGVSVKRG